MIGNKSNEQTFTGTFNGQGYIIQNLNIDRPTQNYVGMFGQSDGVIKNVSADSFNLNGQKYAGGIVEYVS